MEASVLLDFAFGLVTLTIAFIVKRIFVLMDRLQQEDKVLHERITKVQTHYISKQDFDVAITRIIDCINRLEEKIK